MTAQDIISRAISEQRDAFRRACIQQAEMHDNFSLSTVNARARQGAEASRGGLARVALGHKTISS